MLKFTDAQLDAIKGISRELAISRHTVVRRQGEPGNYIFYVVSGLAYVYKTHISGQVRSTRFIQEGEVFGLSILFQNKPYTLTLESMLPSFLLQVAKKDFENLLLQQPDMMQVVYIDLAQRLHRSSELSVEQYATANQKIRESILYIARQLGVPCKDGGRMIPIRFTHEDIAGFSGTSRVTVTRVLQQMVTERFLDMTGKHWIVYDME